MRPSISQFEDYEHFLHYVSISHYPIPSFCLNTGNSHSLFYVSLTFFIFSLPMMTHRVKNPSHIFIFFSPGQTPAADIQPFKTRFGEAKASILDP